MAQALHQQAASDLKASALYDEMELGHFLLRPACCSVATFYPVGWLVHVWTFVKKQYWLRGSELVKHSNHFLDEESISEQDDFTLPLPDFGNDDKNASLDATLPRKKQITAQTQEQLEPFQAKDILSKESSLLQRTLPREIYLSEAFRKQLDEDIPAVAEEDNISALDEFHLPSMDENTLEGIPELSEDLFTKTNLK